MKAKSSKESAAPIPTAAFAICCATLAFAQELSTCTRTRLRHDTARRLVEASDLPTVAAWLGHKRLDTVRLYSQPDEAALERAASTLEKS
jgi:integrase